MLCFWVVGLFGCWVVWLSVGCWVVGLLGCWVVGLLGCWVGGLVGCWIVELDCWIVGLLVCCSVLWSWELPEVLDTNLGVVSKTFW